MKPPVERKLDDPAAEQVRRSHHDLLVALQTTQPGVVPGVTLKDGVVTAILHGLGRRPAAVLPGVPSGATSAGYIVEDRTKRTATSITITAHGYGATIALDMVTL